MDSEELQQKLDERVDRQMKRTLPFDVIYALAAASFLGFAAGFVTGTECTEHFLSKCIAYKSKPPIFIGAFLIVGIPTYLLSFRSLRGRRRWKLWFDN